MTGDPVSSIDLRGAKGGHARLVSAYKRELDPLEAAAQDIMAGHQYAQWRLACAELGRLIRTCELQGSLAYLDAALRCTTLPFARTTVQPVIERAATILLAGPGDHDLTRKWGIRT